MWYGLTSAAALMALCVALNAGSIEKRGEQCYWQGYAYEELGMRANALREYGAAIDAGVDLAAPYYALAALHGAKAERGRAIDVYRKLLARWPQENRAREQLAAQQLRAAQPAAAAPSSGALPRTASVALPYPPQETPKHSKKQEKSISGTRPRPPAPPDTC